MGIFGGGLGALGFCLGAACASAWADGTPLPSDRLQEFKRLLLNHLGDTCQAALVRVPRLVLTEVRGAPGFLIPREYLPPGPTSLAQLREASARRPFRYESHELESTLAYAEWIMTQRGERVVFLPAWGGQSLPAFDGVILDRQGRPVANYTLKTLVESGSRDTFDDRVSAAIRRGREFGILERWAEFVTEHKGRAWGNPNPDTLERQFRNLGDGVQYLREVAEFFGIPRQGGDSRPLGVFVDVRSSEAIPEDWQVSLLNYVLHETRFRGRVTLRRKDGTFAELEGPASS